jgi:nicotinic acid mononucleotide adenylyltransferase
MDKKLYGATLEDRLLMLELFAAQRMGTSVAFSSHGLFLDKALALRKVYPHGSELYFVVGFDTIVRLFDPRYYEDRDDALDSLFSMSHFLVGNRGGEDEVSVQNLLNIPRNRKYAGYIETIRISPRAAAISSTEIREKKERNEELGSTAPHVIVRFIDETALFRPPKASEPDGTGIRPDRYQTRCNIMGLLNSAGLPEQEDMHVGRMVNAVMKGEKPMEVVKRFLTGLH